jgi:hypothetical protein
MDCRGSGRDRARARSRCRRSSDRNLEADLVKRHLEAELKYFQTIRPYLIDKGMLGEVAVIHGTSLVGVFSSYALAHAQGPIISETLVKPC